MMVRHLKALKFLKKSQNAQNLIFYPTVWLLFGGVRYWEGQ